MNDAPTLRTQARLLPPGGAFFPWGGPKQKKAVE